MTPSRAAAGKGLLGGRALRAFHKHASVFAIAYQMSVVEFHVDIQK